MIKSICIQIINVQIYITNVYNKLKKNLEKIKNVDANTLIFLTYLLEKCLQNI